MGISRSTDPTTFDDVDGIVVNESAPSPNIRGASSNIAICVGQFQRGPSGLTEVGSIGEFQEIYGQSSFKGNKQLKKKKFGRLRLIRAIASDAGQATYSFSDILSFTAKYKGLYGNNIQVKIENADNDIFAKTTVAAVSPGSSLDFNGAGLYFLLSSTTIKYYVWYFVSGGSHTQTDPTVASHTGVQVTVLNGDAAGVIATKTANALAALGSGAIFSCSDVASASFTVTRLASGPVLESSNAHNSTNNVSDTVAGVEGGSNYTIHDDNDGAVLPDEVYKNIKVGSITAATFAASQLCDVSVDDADSGEPVPAAYKNLEDGDDGTIADTDYEDAIELAEQTGAGNVLFLDENNSVRNGYLKSHAATAGDKMVIVSGPEVQTEAAAIIDVANYRDSDGRIIYAYPWLETVIDGVTEFTNPAAWYASIISQTSPHIDPAFTDNSQFLSGVTALKKVITPSKYVQFQEAGISAFEFDSDVGFKIKSGIVTQVVNSSKLTVLRRRMTDYLTTSAGSFLKNYQNAVNSRTNRKQVKGTFLDFIQSQESLGILPSNSEVKNGVAKLVDTESLNTDSSIAAGFFRILWKQRIFSSMRYIVLQAEIGESVVVTEGE